MAKQQDKQQEFQDDRSDRESGQPLQLDNEKKKMNEKHGGQYAEGEKEHQGGQAGKQQQGGQHQGGSNR